MSVLIRGLAQPRKVYHEVCKIADVNTITYWQAQFEKLVTYTPVQTCNPTK